MDLSVVVPLYNEEESVVPLHVALTEALAPLDLDYELLFVDDGSRDRTFAVARDLAQGDATVRVVKFRRNYGQTPAMVAGIDHARGDIIVTMDGDLQNDPADIPLFMEKLAEGYDLVVGWRERRQDALITRKVPSRIANWLIGKVTGIPIRDNGCSLKAYRADIIKHIPLYAEMHRFIPAMSSLAGVRVAEIPVRHHARRFGSSKYGLSRIYKVLLDLVVIKTILSFLARPLLGFAWGAGTAALIAIVMVLVAVLKTPDSPVMLAGLGLLYGSLAVNLLLWGVLAELIYGTGDQRIEFFARLSLRAPPQ